MNDKILKKVENALLNVDLETLTLSELGDYVRIAREVGSSSTAEMLYSMMLQAPAGCSANVACEEKTIGSISEVN